MTGSVNHPWAISDSAIKKYGKLWESIDFEINQNIYERSFETRPMDIVVGTLVIDKTRKPLTYKQLLSESSGLDFILSTTFAIKKKGKSNDIHTINIAGHDFHITHRDIKKIADTLSTAIEIISRKYALGLYL